MGDANVSALNPRPVTTFTPKRVSILGATGSIGCSTIDLIRHDRKRYDVVALSAQNNVEKLIAQCLELKPRFAVIGNEAHYQTLKHALAGTGIEVSAGSKALCTAAAQPADWVMAAIVGVAGLKPTMAAIETGATIAFASKECLVCAGELMLKACQQYGATLLPVDSEHNAIFQVFDFDNPQRIEKVTLTASGGPFRSFSLQQLEQVTPEQAIRHPNWDMGAKISVDSATLMNKALEMIEAYHLFPLTHQQIDVVIHPESIIHSFVHYRDGSVLAQLGLPDMRTPIAYTLGWPDRLDTPWPKLDLSQLSQLTFEPADEKQLPVIALAKEVLTLPQSAAIAMNAANEIAAQAFLDHRIGFMDIVRTVRRVIEHDEHSAVTTLDDALYHNEQARQRAQTYIGSL